MVPNNGPLQDLMSFLKDSEHGLNHLGKHAELPQYRDYFAEEALVRRAFHRQLARELEATCGMRTAEEGTRKGKLHRFWINLRVELGGGDAAVLGTAVHCETEALASYSSALKAVSEGDSLRALLDRQAKHVGRSLQIIKTWSATSSR